MHRSKREVCRQRVSAMDPRAACVTGQCFHECRAVPLAREDGVGQPGALLELIFDPCEVEHAAVAGELRVTGLADGRGDAGGNILPDRAVPRHDRNRFVPACGRIERHEERAVEIRGAGLMAQGVAGVNLIPAIYAPQARPGSAVRLGSQDVRVHIRPGDCDVGSIGGQ